MKDLPAGSGVLVEELSRTGTPESPEGPEDTGASEVDPKRRAVWRFFV